MYEKIKKKKIKWNINKILKKQKTFYNKNTKCFVPVDCNNNNIYC